MQPVLQESYPAGLATNDGIKIMVPHSKMATGIYS